VVLFDYFSCEHLSDHIGIATEVRPAVSWMYLYGGELSDMCVRRWAEQIGDPHAPAWRWQLPSRRRPPESRKRRGSFAVGHRGWQWRSGDGVRPLLKSPNEILCMRRAIVSCEAAIAEMHAKLQPGITENALRAELHRGNIVHGGEWIETRLLASGPRADSRLRPLRQFRLTVVVICHKSTLSELRSIGVSFAPAANIAAFRLNAPTADAYK
jgi:hypothetical protein